MYNIKPKILGMGKANGKSQWESNICWKLKAYYTTSTYSDLKNKNTSKKDNRESNLNVCSQRLV